MPLIADSCRLYASLVKNRATSGLRVAVFCSVARDASNIAERKRRSPDRNRTLGERGNEPYIYRATW